MDYDDIQTASREQLHLRAGEISQECERLIRHETPTKAQEQRMDELIKEDEHVTRALKMIDLREAAANPSNRLAGSSLDGDQAATRTRGRTRHAQPWAVRSTGLGEVSDTEWRSRALDAIEAMPVEDTAKERATQWVEGAEDTAMARTMLARTDPAYTSAFRKYLRDPVHGHLDWSAQEQDAFRASRDVYRALNEGSIGAGGAMVPFQLDPSIVLTSTGTLGDTLRDVARIETITTNTWHGVTSQGVTAEWTAEGTEAADASPSVLQPAIPLYKADTWVAASFEFLQDTAFESQLTGILADARAKIESSAHINGTGGTQPTGIVTAIAAVTASRLAATTNGSFGAVDVFGLIGALPARYHRNAQWLGHPNMGYKIRQMATGTGQQSGSFWVDFGGENPSKLVGRNWNEASEMVSTLSAATASNDNVLVVGDFRNYVIVDHAAPVLIFEPLVKGSNQRPTGQAGWYYAWRTGADLINTDSARLLVV